jgi:hypothetical protein
MLASTWRELMKVVTRGDPFQYTVAPGTKFAPFRIRVNAPAPGLILVGTSGLFTKGTGLAAASRDTDAVIREISSPKKKCGGVLYFMILSYCYLLDVSDTHISECPVGGRAINRKASIQRVSDPNRAHQ